MVENISQGFSPIFVGKFLSFRMIIDIVKRWVATKWKLRGCVEVDTIVGALFLFKLVLEEGRIHVLVETWSFGKHSLVLAKLKQDFDPSVDIYKMAPIWIKLP